MRLFALIGVILLLAPLAHAIESADIRAEINSDLSVRNTVTYSFDPPLNSSADYNLPDDTTVTSVTSGGNNLPFTVSGNVLSIQAAGISILTISYMTNDAVFRSDSTYNFFTEFYFEETVETLNVTITLPQGYVIHNNFYRPQDASVSTDGQRIQLGWNRENAQGGQLFAVMFSNPNEQGNPFVFALVVLVLVICAGAVHYRKKVKESFLKGFREDEKKTIEFLQLRKVALQSDLQKQFGFSRAKATRIVTVLEGKGLIRKERYGRTNRLHWLK